MAAFLEYIDHAFAEHYGNGLLVDTSIFLLTLIGATDIALIARHRATRKYDKAGFETAAKVISRLSRILVTPNIVTEVDNLSRQTGSRDLSLLVQNLSRIMPQAAEVYLESARLAAAETYDPLGLTDTGIIEMAERNVVVFTDDLPLTVALERRRLKVINLNRLLA